MNELNSPQENGQLVSAEDDFLVQKVLSYKPIPKEILYYIIINFRNSTRAFDTIEKPKEETNLIQVALALTGELKNITINTSTGTVKIYPSDKEFRYFKATINIMRDSYNRYLPSFQEHRDSLLDTDILFLYYILKKELFLRDYQINNIIGLFLVHFKVGKNVLKDEKQWDEDPTKHQDYKHYLNSTVQSRLKRIKTRYTIAIR